MDDLKPLAYSRVWTNPEDFPSFAYTKRWTDKEHFRTYEPQEDQVRADIQLLYDEIAEYINGPFREYVVSTGAAETVRTAQEEQRVTNENTRVGNESARVSSETVRVANEDDRISAEAARAAAEAARIANEQTRVANEQARVAAEAAREDRETGYVARAENAAAGAEDHSKTSEAWAVGKRGGVDVGPSDPAFRNSAKYWAQQVEGAGRGGVSTFNARWGYVLPTAGDYTAGMISCDGEDAGLEADNVQDALSELAGAISGSGQGKEDKSNKVTVVNAQSDHNHYPSAKAVYDAIPTTLPASDVYTWAKAATKPGYTYSEVGAAAASHNHTISQITDIANASVNYANSAGAAGSASTAGSATYATLAAGSVAVDTPALRNIYAGIGGQPGSLSNGEIYLQYETS